MPVSELHEWVEFAELEPFGEHVADLRAGMVAATVANVNRDPEKKREPFSALDFAPWNPLSQQQAEPMTFDDPQQHADAIDRALFGGLLAAPAVQQQN